MYTHGQMQHGFVPRELLRHDDELLDSLPPEEHYVVWGGIIHCPDEEERLCDSHGDEWNDPPAERGPTNRLSPMGPLEQAYADGVDVDQNLLALEREQRRSW